MNSCRIGGNSELTQMIIPLWLTWRCGQDSSLMLIPACALLSWPQVMEMIALSVVREAM